MTNISYMASRQTTDALTNATNISSMYDGTFAATSKDYGNNGDDWSGNPAGCEAFIRYILKPR